MEAHFSKEVNVTIKSIELACKVISVFNTSKNSLSKEDSSPVTLADFSAQLVIAYFLKKEFANDKVISEESSDVLKEVSDPSISFILETLQKVANIEINREDIFELLDYGKMVPSSQRVWTIDPIDGTKGYLRGGQYSVCVALLIDNKVQVGCIGAPNLAYNETGEKGVLFFAQCKKGSYKKQLNSQSYEQIKTSETKELQKVKICESFEKSHSDETTVQRIMAELKTQQEAVRMDSQCKYGMIASGSADVYLRIPTNSNYVEKIWDHAGGYLIVREAGGLVTDIHGKDLDFSHGAFLKTNRGIVAANKHLYHKIIQIAAKFIA